MNKENTYTQLLPQIAAMIEGETCETSVLANVAAALHQAFDQFFGRASTCFTPMVCYVWAPFKVHLHAMPSPSARVCAAKPLRQRIHWLFPTWNNFLDT